MRTTKTKKATSLLLTSLALTLTFNPIISYAALIQLPDKITNVKYPDEIQQLINDILFYVERAEAKILGKTSDSFDASLTLEQVDQIYQSYKNTNGQSVFKFIVSSDLENQNNAYYKDTHELELAMTMFLYLNNFLYGDVQSDLKQVNDVIDVTLYRIINLLYELPKVQGHPLILQFAKHSRDLYLFGYPTGKFAEETGEEIVIRSPYFRNVVYFLEEANEDKELNEKLLRFVYHIEESDSFTPGTYIPNENSQVYFPESSPEVDVNVDSEQQAKDDLESIWDDFHEEKEAIELAQNPPKPQTTKKPINKSQRTKTNYRLENDVCYRMTEIYSNGVLVDSKTEPLTLKKGETCGNNHDINWDEVEQQVKESTANDFYVRYRYGTETKFIKTNVLTETDSVTFKQALSILKSITSNYGTGYVSEESRSLFVLDGKAIILNQFEGQKTIPELQQWLNEQGIVIELKSYIPQTYYSENVPTIIDDQTSEQTK